MTDARWSDVDDDVIAATEHFVMADALHESGRFGDASLESYRDRMALMHALQSAHTSAEKALVRPSIEAARRLAVTLRRDVDLFREAIDPVE